LEYLDSVDPQTAEIARVRYGCLTPWTSDPSLYAQVGITKQYRKCEHDVLITLQDLIAKRLNYCLADGENVLNAEQNARLVANAERYYRTVSYAENN
jgi:erythromycin esterase-like protein